MRAAWSFLPLVVLAAASCTDQPTHPAQSADAPLRSTGAAAGVEHWTVQKGGYAVSLYPGFASRAVLQTAGGPVELYRQNGSYRLPDGAPGAARQHQIALQGGRYGRDLALSVHDPKHEVARVRVYLYGDDHVPGSGIQTEPVETLDVDNKAATCPPACKAATTSGAASTVSTADVDVAATFMAPAIQPRVTRAGGYDFSVDPSFSSRAVAEVHGGEAVELYRQNGIFNLPVGFTVPAAGHQIRLAGGQFVRNVALQVRDPLHHIARIDLELYNPARGSGGSPNETVTILNKAATCPPNCVTPPPGEDP